MSCVICTANPICCLIYLIYSLGSLLASLPFKHTIYTMSGTQFSKSAKDQVCRTQLTISKWNFFRSIQLCLICKHRSFLHSCCLTYATTSKGNVTSSLFHS